VLFTSVEYLILLATVFVLYWTIRVRTVQNALLLATSYVFYGWVHPWFCILIAASTVADYFFARAIRAQPSRARLWLGASLVFNLGLLGFYKYFDFFAANVHAALTALGIPSDPVVLGVLLPVGISFYTFQTLSYTIDVYRGELEPRRSFLDFALFVSFFPQLVAGPIERARDFLPQVERARRFRWDLFASAWPLLVSGYFKKMVVADNVASSSDLVFALESPSFTVLLAGTIAFAAQIACDFSGYTDIARGSARLLGFELIRNFNLPYLAISPSDFWRRWHISFSSWIRDYLYIPLGGSKAGGKLRLLLVLLASMGLSGLWHGAAWNFVLWGVFHAVVLFLYHAAGLGGAWRPRTRAGFVVAWLAMTMVTLVGWAIFRTESVGWLWNALAHGGAGLDADSLAVLATISATVACYALPLTLDALLRRLGRDRPAGWTNWARAVLYGLLLAGILVFGRTDTRDFIYFQF
jgi:D-alanyl-lipoteichoic acid acyltransferase DltB (MBOAT superfamily)